MRASRSRFRATPENGERGAVQQTVHGGMDIGHPLMQRAGPVPAADASPEGALTVLIHPLEEPERLLEHDFRRVSGQDESAAGAGRSFHEPRLRQDGENLGHDGR